jgi:hypothetical protein
MSDILFYLLLSFVSFNYSYFWLLYITAITLLGVIWRIFKNQKLSLGFLSIVFVFTLLQIAIHLQPPGSTEQQDMVLGRYLSIVVNPITKIIFGVLTTMYFVKSVSNKFKYFIIVGILISCFVVNGLIYDSVFFYVRDNVITKFYPYSRKQSPTSFQEHLKKCLPNTVKQYNRYVKMYQRNLTENPNYFKEQWDADANIVSPEHLQKLYNDPTYFEPYLKLCYNDQPPEPNFINPFLGMDKLPEDNSPIQYQNGIF